MKRIFIFAFILSVCVALPAYANSQSYNPIGKGCTNAFYIDKDCDGYGVASPLGVDADDNDPEVNTPETVIAKYGTLENFLHHLGYYPDRIFYIATNGDDDTGEVDNINKPYKTWNKVLSFLQPGDLVIFREGIYNYLGTYGIEVKSSLHGTLDKPIVVMTYPGEKVIIDGPDGGIYLMFSDNSKPSYLTFDGFILENTQGSWGHGFDAHFISHIILRNLEVKHHSSGIYIMHDLHDLLIENCVVHDNTHSHGFYLGCTYGWPTNTDITVRNCIMYRNGRHGFQHNGRVKNLILENNIIHSNELGGISLIKLGDYNPTAIVRNNLIFNNNKQGIVLFIYEASTEPAYTIANTKIINNLIWVGKYKSVGEGTISSHAITMNDVTGRFTMKNLVFRNNIIMTYDTVPFRFCQLRHLYTAVIENNVLYKKGNYPSIVMISDEGQGQWDFDQFENFTKLIKSNVFQDPKFTNVSIDYNLNPEKFNFDYLSNSSVRDFGSPVDAPSTDLRGNPRDENSDAGCYEYGRISTNKPPIANAGEDKITIDYDNDWKENITLNASQSHDLEDGQIVHYLWYEKEEQLGNQKVITLPFSVGTHQVKLMTVDDKGALSYDMITVEVRPGPNVIILKDGLHYAIRSDLPDKHVPYASWANTVGLSSSGIWRLFLIFNNLDSILGDIPEDNQIVESKLKLYEYSYFKAEGKSVSIYSLKHSFDTETVTWNNYSEGNLWSTPGAYDENDIDITPLATVTLDDQINIWREWDITDYVKALRNGTKQNYGLLIKQDNESEGESRYKMTNDPDESLRPQLVIIFSKSLVIIIDDSLPDATLGEQYNYSLNVVGGNPPYNFSLSSRDLPGGIFLSSDGELSGIPNQTGTFNFIIQVEDLVNETSAKEFNLTVNSG